MLQRFFDLLLGRPSPMKPDKLIVGLGNPGNQYKGTRHNAGFMVVAELAKRLNASRRQIRFNAEVIETQRKGCSVALMAPMTFMNLSGNAVSAAMRFYKMVPESLLVICDDVDLPVGKIRIRTGGGSGGQKGLKDIAQKIATEEFHRLRLGVGRPAPSRDLAEYVLSPFSKSEKELFDLAILTAADAAILWIEEGCPVVMNRYN